MERISFQKHKNMKNEGNEKNNIKNRQNEREMASKKETNIFEKYIINE